MSLTLEEIFALNPTATIGNNDLFYLVQPPYTPGTDAAILGSDLKTAMGAGTVTSISAGTGITLTPNPITTTGSIALTIPVTSILGGTGQTSYALGDTLYSSAANILSKLAGNITTVKLYLSQTGTGAVSAAPIWSTIAGGDVTGAALSKTDDTNVTLTLGGTPLTALLRATSLTLGWTGELSLARGGTNANLVASIGGIFYSTATAGAILSGTATAGQVLQSGSNAPPSWSTATYPSVSGAIGNVLTSDGTNWLSSPAVSSGTVNSGLINEVAFYAAAGTAISPISPTQLNGLLVTDNTGVPSILAGPGTTGNVLQSNAAGSPSFSTATYPSTATNAARILRSNGTNWVETTSTFADVYAASSLLYANGANNIAGLATVNNAYLTTNGSGVPTWSTTPPITQVNTQTITATGAFNYTPTAGTQYAIFELQGGGGGSGGSAGAGSQASCAGSGGGGGYLKILVSGSANLAAISGNVAIAGTAGASGAGNSGGAGGNTTLVVNGGSTWSANGGGAGAGSAAASSAAANGALPGAGGTNTLGTNATLQVAIRGQAGDYGFFSASGGPPVSGAAGGNSQLGKGGVFGSLDGFNYGGGGGGFANRTGANSVGFAGAPGIVLVTEFISA